MRAPFTKHTLHYLWAPIGFIVLLACLITVETSSAQQLPTRIFTERDGLPSNAIFGITQDIHGEIWFASRGGVVRYDGHQWITYGRREGLARDNFRRITVDRTGTVWAATMTTPFSVAFFKEGKWTSLPTPDLDKWGWDLTDFKTHIKEDGTPILALSSATSISLWDGEQWQSLETLGDFATITALEWVGNELWVATDKGLRGIDLANKAFLSEPVTGLPEGPVLGIALAAGGLEVDLLGTHWIGTLKHGRFSLVASQLDINFTKKGSGVTLLRGPAGGWYFGDLDALYYYNTDLGLQNLSLNNGMASVGASCLFRDRENNIWVGSLRGVTRIGGRHISSFDKKQGLLGDEVTSVLQLRSGAMVLGHGLGLTFLGDPNTTLAFPQRPGISSRVIDLTEGPDGKIWMAADRYGLGYVDQQKNIHWIPENQFPSQGTFAVLFDQQGQLWVGGSHGLFRREGEIFAPISLPDMDPVLSPFVRRLSLDKDGALLVATGMHGVYRLHKGNIDHWIKHGNNGAARGSFCIFPHPDEGYFIGTNVGLYRIMDNKIAKSVAPGPFIDRPVYSITSDNEGRIWFGSDVGALRWNGSELESFDISDGLLGNETNRDALLLDDHNNMWIGTDQGLSIYRPEFDLITPGQPLVSLVNFQVGDKSYPANQPLELPSSSLEMVIQFRGVTMHQENDVQFKTWLDPFQDTWQDARIIPTREVRYTNLSPGSYTFHIQAIRSDGVESEIIHSKPITVLPPIWQSWWFISIALLTALGILWSILSYLSSRRYTLRLKLAVQEKTAELQASETAVKIESQRLSTTLHNISDGVVTVSSLGIIELANPAALVIMGQSAEEILGAPLDSVFALTVHESEKTEPAQDPDANLPNIFSFVAPDGQQKDLEISTSNIESQGEQAGGQVLAFRDITYRRQLEKELVRTQKLESLGVLAGGIAHDFNNLLTIMLGNLALVIDSKGLNDRERHQLQRMKLATKRSQTLANQLLTFAKGGTPRLEKAHPTDLVPMAVSFALSGSSVQYKIQIDQDVRCVNVDPGQFDQVISNLVINASQAMDGQGTINIIVKNVPHRPEFPCVGEHVMFEIRDEGCGIPAQNLGQIFDPYFTSKDTGSGLGLTTAYSIINKHDGYMAVQSEPGEGTTFQLLLPACDCETLITQVPSAKKLSGLQSILILDDEPDVREILSRMLADLGFASVAVNEGAKAVATYKKAMDSDRPFAAVIVDLTIPGGMGGKETLTHLLAMDPSVKAIVVSGYSTESVMSDYARYGFSGAIRKPFDQVALADSIKDLLGE